MRRSKGSHALLEGERLIAEAIVAGVVLDEVLMTPEFEASAAGLAIVRQLTSPPLLVADEALRSLADTDSPPGVLAIAQLPRQGAAALPVSRDGLYLFVDGLQVPANLGALARVAEAAGAVGMALAPGTVNPNHPRALRGSAGSLLRLPVAVEVTPGMLDERLAAITPRWAGLATRGGETLWGADLRGCLVLALGAEGPGISPAVKARVSRLLTVPLAPPVESLNATVAAALALFEARRQRAAAGEDAA